MQSINWKRLAAAACGLLIVGTGAALAQSGTSSPTGLKLSGDKPIQIESDKLEVHQDQNVAIFTGNVSVVQGPTLLKSGTMKVFYVKSDKPGEGQGGGAASAMTGASDIDHIEVDGKVYIKSDDQIATGDKGTFDMKTEVLVLSGDKVVLTQGPNVLVGCKLTVQMKTGLAQVDGCGGRVQMSLTPDSQKKP